MAQRVARVIFGLLWSAPEETSDMPLIIYPDCSNQVSDGVPMCPKHGDPGLSLRRLAFALLFFGLVAVEANAKELLVVTVFQKDGMLETLFVDPKEIPDSTSCTDAGKRFDKHAAANPDPAVQKFEWRCADSTYVFSAATDDVNNVIMVRYSSGNTLSVTEFDSLEKCEQAKALNPANASCSLTSQHTSGTTK
jgi:hypothetical protein